jgi:hypothetical protein
MIKPDLSNVEFSLIFMIVLSNTFNLYKERQISVKIFPKINNNNNNNNAID